MVRDTATSNTSSDDWEPKGIFGGMAIFEKILLIGYIVIFAISYVPVAINSNIQVAGLPWLFIIFPTGMVIYTGIYLILTYYTDLSLKPEQAEEEKAGEV